MTTRRKLLHTAPLWAAVPAVAAPEPSFTFVHFTDPHIMPERRAAAGCRLAFARMSRLRPAFAIAGGDLVFDVMETGPGRAKALFDLYAESIKPLEIPVHSVIGNHDVFGLSPKSTVAASDPLYGKRMFEDRIGRRYKSFDHQGWHFVLLDTIGATPDRRFVGRVDDEQLDWLKTDLERVGPQRPVVVVTHVPLVSAVLQLVPDPWRTAETYLVTNAQEVLAVLGRSNVKAVLQGHTHICEMVEHHGCRYITSGAVSGNWWQGPRLGHPEGFGVLTVRGEAIAWRYEKYGFKAEAE